MSYLYVFSDKGTPNCCKIGTSSTLEVRYKQARCHTPRGIKADAFFSVSSSAHARAAESATKRLLAPHQRPGHVKEWFDLPAAEVIDRISALPELSGCNPMRNLTPKLKSNDILYDDWREQRKKYIDQKWRLFLFQEDSPRPYIKLSYGALYEHAYRYAFTFNPYPVYVVAGFDDPGAPERKTALNEDRNRRVVEAWQSVQKSLGSLFAEEVGWLKAGTQPADVARILEQYGIRAFDLARPKPAGAPLTEASLKTGGPLPMARVRPAADIY